jgi:hypothetical protein
VAAVLLLLGLMSAPVLGAYCEASCADATGPIAAVPSCHETPSDTTGPAVRTTEDCGDHTSAPAVPSELRSGRIVLSLWATALSTTADLSHAQRVAEGVTTIDPHDTPPLPIPPGTTILRI